MDPATSVILYSIAQSISSRFAQKWVMSSSDKAAHANVELRKQEMDAQDRRFYEQQTSLRELELLKLDKMLDNNIAGIDHADILRRWPLGVHPSDMLRACRSREGRSINLIVAVIDPRDQHYLRDDQTGKGVNLTLDLLMGKPLARARDLMYLFKDDLFFYHPKPIKDAHLSGIELVATIWGRLNTEPTILVEINIPSPFCFQIHISHWEGVVDTSGKTSPWMSFPPMTIDLSNPLPEGEDQIKQAKAQLQAAMEWTLPTILVYLADTFRTLARPQEFHSPVFPLIPTQVQEAGNSSQRVLVWEQVVPAYISMFDRVAESTRSPFLASELAAKTAIASYDTGEKDFAERLLTKAISLHPSVSHDADSDDAIMAALQKFRGSRQVLSELEQALMKIRQATLHSDEFAVSIEDIARRNTANIL